MQLSSNPIVSRTAADLADELTPELLQSCEVDADSQLRAALRRLAKAGNSVPIRVIVGDASPHKVGGYDVTPATWRAMRRHGVDEVGDLPVGEPATIVRSRNAYRYACVRLTAEVRVGADYLAAHLPVLLAEQAA